MKQAGPDLLFCYSSDPAPSMNIYVTSCYDYSLRTRYTLGTVSLLLQTVIQFMTIGIAMKIEENK